MRKTITISEKQLNILVGLLLPEQSAALNRRNKFQHELDKRAFDGTLSQESEEALHGLINVNDEKFANIEDVLNQLLEGEWIS